MRRGDNEGVKDVKVGGTGKRTLAEKSRKRRGLVVYLRGRRGSRTLVEGQQVKKQAVPFIYFFRC